MSGRTIGQVGYTAPRGTIPYRPSIIDIQGAHAPLHPRKTQKDKVGLLAATQVGLYIPLNAPIPCSERQLKRAGGE